MSKNNKPTANEKEGSETQASANPPAPNTDQNTNQNTNAPGEQSQNEEGNAPEDTVVKSNFAKIKIENFRGHYLDAHFDENGLCERISTETLIQLQKDFPGAVITGEVVE